MRKFHIRALLFLGGVMWFSMIQPANAAYSEYSRYCPLGNKLSTNTALGSSSIIFISSIDNGSEFLTTRAFNISK